MCVCVCVCACVCVCVFRCVFSLLPSSSIRLLFIPIFTGLHKTNCLVNWYWDNKYSDSGLAIIISHWLLSIVPFVYYQVVVLSLSSSVECGPHFHLLTIRWWSHHYHPHCCPLFQLLTSGLAIDIIHWFMSSVPFTNKLVVLLLSSSFAVHLPGTRWWSSHCHCVLIAVSIGPFTKNHVVVLPL